MKKFSVIAAIALIVSGPAFAGADDVYNFEKSARAQAGTMIEMDTHEKACVEKVRTEAFVTKRNQLRNEAAAKYQQALNGLKEQRCPEAWPNYLMETALPRFNLHDGKGPFCRAVTKVIEDEVQSDLDRAEWVRQVEERARIEEEEYASKADERAREAEQQARQAKQAAREAEEAARSWMNAITNSDTARLPSRAFSLRSPLKVRSRYGSAQHTLPHHETAP